MSSLPRFVQRAPAFLYGAAVIYFLGSVILSHLQWAEAYRGVTPSFDRMDATFRLGLFNAWLQAAEGAIYLVANGVIAQILLAIWRDGHGSDRGGGE